MSEHISRKELKHDRIKETFEHGAEAVISHSQAAVAVVVTIIFAVVVFGGWTFYRERKNNEAMAAFNEAKKSYDGRIRVAGEPTEPSELTYPDEAARSTDAVQKLTAVADKYSNTDAGKLARYYSALSMEDLERHNQALEALKPISSSGDDELAAMAQYQTAVIYARTGKNDDAIKIYRALSLKNSVFVPRPLVLLELAHLLRTSNPKEAESTYQQIKKDFPDSAVSEEADRGLQMLAAKS